MNTIITVFKSEFNGKEQILEELEECCAVMGEVASAIIISPRSGKLFQTIELLRSNKVVYRTHFDTLPEQKQNL